MSEVDLAALAVGALVLLLWWPASLPTIGRSKVADTDQVEWLTRLGGQLAGAGGFAQAVADLGGIDSLQSTRAQLQQLLSCNAELGLPAADCVALLIADARAEVTAVRRWREQTSAAQVSSWLLAGLPLPLWLVTAANGTQTLGWLFESGIGWGLLIAFGLLTLLARRWLTRLRRSALAAATQLRPGVVLPPKVAALLLGCTVGWLVGGSIGVVAGIAVAGLARQLWPRFQQRSELARLQLQQAERPWLTCLLASALGAGVDWPRATRLLIDSAEFADQQTFAAIAQRLDWGVDPVEAFASAGELWQPLARSLRQCAESGVPVRYGLLQLATHWQQELHSLQLARVERFAARAVLPVSLLQLPAFIIGGLLPTVAVSLQPLFELFASTGA